MIKRIKIEPAKKVKTFDAAGKENGFLVELLKKNHQTVAYLTSIKAHGFKGYHLHRVRAARYICLKGKIKIITYQRGRRREYVLDSKKPQRLFIPNNVATGLKNIGSKEAWLINYPFPPYNPSLKNEQVEYTEAELVRGVVK